MDILKNGAKIGTYLPTARECIFGRGVQIV